MKKFNLFKEIITVDTKKLQDAVNTGEHFAIDIEGEICHEPFSSKNILIYSGIPEKDKDLESCFGNKYQIVISDERVLIKAFANWQGLIAINTPLASYDDTTADGVAEFSYKGLEDIGWHSTEFSIAYRELVEVLEEKAEGTVLCIEQEEPYQFSGFGFLANDEDAEKLLYTYCQEKIKNLIQNDEDYAESNLEDDQALAASFFKLL